MLRRVGIAHKRNILDLGAGYGFVSEELARRSEGSVVALDRTERSLREMGHGDRVLRIAGDAANLPLVDSSFDLVFCQYLFIWIKHLEKCVREIQRVLQPRGTLLVIEPFYPSMLEYPKELACRDIWLNALQRAGADPEAALRLPPLLERKGFSMRIDLVERLLPSSPVRFQLLRELPLTSDEIEKVNEIEERSAGASTWSQISHLPFILITAELSAKDRRTHESI
jgi:SAM-dependent methyltransferase